MNKKEQQEEKYRRITQAKIYPLLWRMAIPSMIGMMVSSVYSMTDTFFVGLLGRTELTASVGIVFSFISMIQAIGFWFGYGSGNYASRQIGKKNIGEAEKMASIGFTLAIAAGLVIFILGMIFLRPLAALLGAGISEELMKATLSYLRITLISVPFLLAANVLYNVLRLQGSARDSMIGMLAGMLLNIILDPVFILGLHMGVAGAALASLIGQICGFLLLLQRTGRGGNVSVYFGRYKPDLVHVKEIIAGGAPNFCRQGITSISGVLLNQAAGNFGESGVAGVTVALRIIAMGYALVIGFGQGFQPICLVNYGAGKYGRIKEAFRDALITATVFLIIAAMIILFKAEGLVTVFTEDEAAGRIAADILKAQCAVLPFMGYYILIGMFLQNIGQFTRATLVTVAENGIFLIPAVFIMPALLGYKGFVWCKPAASIGALAFSLFIGTRIWKTHMKSDGGN